MFKLISILVLVTSVACSHVRPIGYDKQANTVFIEAGKFSTEGTIAKVARDQCGGDAKLVGTNRQPNGRIVSIGNGISIQKKSTIYTFSCANPVSEDL